MGRVIDLAEQQPDWALQRLNRVTGLNFSRLPQSLLTAEHDADEPPAAWADRLSAPEVALL